MHEAWLKVARAPALDGQRLLELLPTVSGIDALLALSAAELAALGAARGKPEIELAASSLLVLARSLPADNFRVLRAMALQGE